MQDRIIEGTTAAQFGIVHNRLDQLDRSDGGAGFDSDTVNVTLPDGRSVSVSVITDDNGKTHASVYVHAADAALIANVTFYGDGRADVRDLREEV